MPMFNAFQNFIKKEKLFTTKTKLLLAFSGGADSVCLFHLLLKGGYNFSIAHCNFNLREHESNGDEAFVVGLAKKHHIGYFVQSFDTQKYMKEQKLSIQEAARNLRYQWFETLLHKHNFKKLITAHHQTDNAETMLINMLRGTGIKGLHGILFNTQNIIRPLMFTTKNDILAFLKTSNFKFREDSSNASNKYVRNQLRHHVLDNLANINPAFETNFFNTAQKVSQFEKLGNELIEQKWRKMTSKDVDSIKINTQKLNELENKNSFLFYVLQPYGFTIEQINSMLVKDNLNTFRVFFSAQYSVMQERDSWHLKLTESEKKLDAITIKKPIKNLKIGALTISIQHVKNNVDIDFTEKNIQYLNADLVNFPLKLRTWQAGDKMIPFGMKGSKKISDILTDKKVKKSEKETILVLENMDSKIIALIPFTIHNTFQINSNSKNILAISIKNA